jgi:uncharacterized membrane protein YbhN (UPF0104 family)
VRSEALERWLDLAGRRPVSAGAFSHSVRSPLGAFAPVVLVGAVAAGVAVLRGPLSSVMPVLDGARPGPLVLAGACALAVPLAQTLAWYAVLAPRNGTLRLSDACACYGIGSLANAVLPAKLGEPIRIELFARRLSGPRARVRACAASGAVGLGQVLALAGLLAAGALTGALPRWAVLPALALPLALAYARRFVTRLRPDGRAARAAAATGLSGGAWAAMLGSIAAAAICRVAAVGLVLEALAVPHPLTGAVVALTGAALGNAIPVAPGGLGLPAAAMAIALGRSGVDSATAAAAAMTFHLLETAASFVFGGTGCILGRRAP